MIANINSNCQAVIGGASKAVEQAMETFQKAGYERGRRCRSATRSTPRLWLAASVPLRQVLERLRIQSPRAADRRQRERRVLSHGTRMSFRRCWTFSRSRSPAPVQFVKGLRTLVRCGRARLR